MLFFTYSLKRKKKKGRRTWDTFTDILECQVLTPRYDSYRTNELDVNGIRLFVR